MSQFDLFAVHDDDVVCKALEILESRLSYALDAPSFTSAEDTKKYCKLRIGGRPAEVFMVLFLDSRNRLISCDEMFFGTIDGSSVHPREVVRAALGHNAAACILAHNHPSGVCTPSQADRNLTNRLKDTLELIDVRVLDHLVVSPVDCVSFAERGWI